MAWWLQFFIYNLWLQTHLFKCDIVWNQGQKWSRLRLAVYVFAHQNLTWKIEAVFCFLHTSFYPLYPYCALLCSPPPPLNLSSISPRIHLSSPPPSLCFYVQGSEGSLSCTDLFSFTLQMHTACRPFFHTCTHLLILLCGVGQASCFKPLKGVNTIHLTPLSPFFLFCFVFIKPACSSWA